MPPRSFRSHEGSASVEFALVLPLLFVVCLAFLQVGLLVRDQILVVEAARAGAREAAVSASDESVRAAAADAAAALDPASMVVGIERGAVQGEPVTVSIAYAATGRIPFVEWLVPGDLNLTAATTMRREYP